MKALILISLFSNVAHATVVKGLLMDANPITMDIKVETQHLSPKATDLIINLCAKENIADYTTKNFNQTQFMLDFSQCVERSEESGHFKSKHRKQSIEIKSIYVEKGKLESN